MGQQQLLLIIVGVIIVATAIAVGVQLFSVGAKTANREAIVNDISSIVGHAQGYYTRPSTMGGGNGSFEGYNLPARLSETGNASYEAEGSDDGLVIEGTSVIDGRIVVTLILTHSSDSWQYNWLWEHEGL